MKYKSLTELFAEAKATPLELNWEVLDEDPSNGMYLLDVAESAMKGLPHTELMYMRLIHDEEVFQMNPWRLMPEEERDGHALALADELLNRYRMGMVAETFCEVSVALTKA